MKLFFYYFLFNLCFIVYMLVIIKIILNSSFYLIIGTFIQMININHHYIIHLLIQRSSSLNIISITSLIIAKSNLRIIYYTIIILCIF